MTDDGRDRRQEAVRHSLEGPGLDGLLVSSSANIRYLTGFSGSAGLLLVGRTRTVLLTDFRYASQAPAEVGPSAEVEIERLNVWDAAQRGLQAAGIARLGVEREHLTLKDWERLERWEGIEPVPTSDLVEALRASKEPEEVAAIRDAAALALDALEEVLAFLRPGRSEFEIAGVLEGALRRRGSEWHPFPSIVASGPRSALPHARTSPRTVERGEWLLLDFGAQIRGYCADITRTVVVGARADARQREVYQLVQRAQARARGALRAGMSGREADALARDPIADAGYGDAFGHSLGHGLGLQVHEAPRLSQTNPAPLPSGAVVTVEPGVYLEGWGGVRIEDDVHLGAEGAECLSGGHTELIELT